MFVEREKSSSLKDPHLILDALLHQENVAGLKVFG